MGKFFVRVERMFPEVELPEYKSEQAAGMDLKAFLPDTGGVSLSPGQRVMIPTGLKVAFPEGYVMLLFARSGWAAKYGVALANGVGVVDSDYRGEVLIALENKNSKGETLMIRHGDRVAQAVFVPIIRAGLEVVDKVSETIRGEGGWGSTGR